MATMLKCAVEGLGCRISTRGYTNSSLPPPLERIMDFMKPQTSLVLPEFSTEEEFGFGGSMELMAVPKKKISKYKRGIRNGPKALKPIPIILRCKTCGKIKLPHFYCCSGDRGLPG